MIDPTQLMQRAKSIRTFIQDRTTRPEYIAGHFKKLFKLSDTYSSASDPYPSKPGPPGLLIKDVDEKAFQRAIFHQRVTKMEFPTGEREGQWLDYELPVLPGRASRRCACDLIAKIQDSDTTICEAKYSSPQKASGSREPDYAVFELLFQLQAVALHAPQFDKNHHQGEGFVEFSWGDIASANIALVVANRSWWNGKGERDRERILQLIEDIRKEIGIEILLFQTEDVAFSPPSLPYKPAWQKGISTRWEPALKF